MFNINKDYNEIAYRERRRLKIPNWYKNERRLIKSVTVMCPHCGALLPLTTKGCDNCLYQLSNGGKIYVE